MWKNSLMPLTGSVIISIAITVIVVIVIIQSDLEITFTAITVNQLHPREFEAEYASTVFDSALSPHTPLDCSATKARVQRQKSFKSSLPSPSLPSPCPPLASPRQRTYQQSSNVARQLKQEEASPARIVLGREPDVRPQGVTAARWGLTQPLLHPF